MIVGFQRERLWRAARPFRLRRSVVIGARSSAGRGIFSHHASDNLRGLLRLAGLRSAPVFESGRGLKRMTGRFVHVDALKTESLKLYTSSPILGTEYRRFINFFKMYGLFGITRGSGNTQYISIA